MIYHFKYRYFFGKFSEGIFTDIKTDNFELLNENAQIAIESYGYWGTRYFDKKDNKYMIDECYVDISDSSAYKPDNAKYFKIVIKFVVLIKKRIERKKKLNRILI